MVSIALRDQLIKSIIFQFGEPCRESLSIDETRQREQAGKIRARTGSEKMRPPPLSAKERTKKERKDAQPTKRTATLWGLSSKIDSRIWMNLTRTEDGVKASRATTHRRVKEFGKRLSLEASYFYSPVLLLKEKKNWTVAQWSKVLFSDESQFCISFGNKFWRKGGEAHSPSCLKSSVKFPQSVMIWGAMSFAGVGPLCFLKTNVTAPVYQDILEHFMLSSADQIFKDADFIFQQDLAPAHTAERTKTWLNDHGVGVLDWPANSPDLNPIENLWGIVKRKMRNKRPKNADELKTTVKETWASIPPQQCHKLITATLNWGSN